jgi:hypothetical protein
MADLTDLVARHGFSVPKLSGSGEQRFEAGDKVPAKALTDKSAASLLKQGVIAHSDDDDPPVIPWQQGHTIVDGVELVAATEEVV